MATQSRILADGRIKLVMVVMCCITAWYLGQVLADHIFDGFLHKQLKTIQKIVQKPTFKEPAPKHHKCGHRNPCPTGTFAFTVLSGAERINPPKICFEDEILLGSMKNNFGRGMNIAIVEAKTGKFVNAGCFDLWEGDNSGQMIEFIKKAPDGSLILMATFDDSSTRLSTWRVQIISMGAGQQRSRLMAVSHQRLTTCNKHLQLSVSFTTQLPYSQERFPKLSHWTQNGNCFSLH
ncbi:protein FAM3B-like isoform X2 [Stegostoma tigrinum]|uniref:protein FAM3B-like isoform X2 n=1 Tax=Stegostoma tigrinum TaxID=3053191 RepID=UPI00202AFB70|nr:protein FAM3B-like isoform X2 [Stegostoma tigrinum]